MELSPEMQVFVDNLCHNDVMPSKGGPTMAQIRVFAKKLGLDIAGTRAQLRDRICSHLLEITEGPKPVAPAPATHGANVNWWGQQKDEPVDDWEAAMDASTGTEVAATSASSKPGSESQAIRDEIVSFTSGKMISTLKKLPPGQQPYVIEEKAADTKAASTQAITGFARKVTNFSVQLIPLVDQALESWDSSKGFVKVFEFSTQECKSDTLPYIFTDQVMPPGTFGGDGSLPINILVRGYKIDKNTGVKTVYSKAGAVNSVLDGLSRLYPSLIFAEYRSKGNGSAIVIVTNEDVWRRMIGA